MLTRRKFIGTPLVAGAALTTSAQQARPQPASKRTIVDAQVHFWKANSPDWAWDSRCQAAIAGTIHHRARAANDGRSWRRPRSHRAAGPERP